MASFLRMIGVLPNNGATEAAPGASKDDSGAPQPLQLDIDEVEKRIYACGRPSSRPTDVADHRNNIVELAKHLDTKLGENYLVVNLSNKNRNMIDYSKFHNSVVEFQPFSRADLADDTPAMGQIFRICYALSFWLAWGPETQLVLHCNTGVYRTGFILACYMVYSGACGSVEQAMGMFADARKSAPDSSVVARMLPSWRYLMQQVDKFMRGPPSLPKVWKLNYIVISAPGLSLPSDKDFPAIQLFEGPRVMFDSTKDAVPSDTIRFEDGKLIVEVGQLICGDYQLWVLTPARERASASSLPVADAADSSTTGARRIRKHAARFAFHSSMLEEGINTFSCDEVDIWRANIDKKDFGLTLLTGAVPTDEVVKSNIDKAVKRSYINLKGPPAIVKGAEEYSAHVYVFPDAKSLKQLLSEGFDETAAVCALQRAGNHMGKTREYLQAAIMRDYFKEPAALRDLKLLRDTLSMEEVAAAFLARGNVGRKKKGIGLDDLDVGGLLEAAKLGNLAPGGSGDGTGTGGGGGGGKGSKKKKRKGKKGRGGKDDDDSDSSESDSNDDGKAKDEEDSEDDEVDAFIGGGKGGADGGPAPKLFANDAEAKDEDEDEEDEGPIEEDDEEGGGPWLMKEHPIFSKWFQMLAEGKSKAEVLEVLNKDQFNPALLDVDANAPVPEDMPAALVPLKDWEFFQKYFKMMKVGLPRPVVEHKMISENANPAVLDADENAPVLACNVSPPKKKKSNKPQVVRKKLHWVPIRGKIESTIWAGPPGDLIAAASQLIDNEAEFERLFIQKPEDLKKKKKKDKDNGGIIQLLDGKRSMNVGIALAKLKMPYSGVVECLNRMTCKCGKYMLSLTEVANLVTLCPTDEEIKTVKGFKGDTSRLGQPEQFMLAVADVAMARQRAEGLLYQANFDERVKESLARIALFGEAINQIRSANRLQRFLKATLVLGNKMNGVTKKNKKQLVKAFTVNSLHQLNLTKAFDQQTSVLQYLIKLLKRKDPDLLRLSKDFKGTVLAEAKRLPLDVMNEEMKELREGLTQLEAVVREAAQNGAGWAAMTSGGGQGATYVEEEVEEPKDAKETATAPAKDGPEEPPAPAETGGESAPAAGAGTEQPAKKKKKIRRRIEPLPEFAAIAQNELSKLEEAFNNAQTGYKDLIKFWKEDSELPADELFGNLHLFLQTFDTTLNAMVEKKKKAKDQKRRAKEMKKAQRSAARKRAIEAGEELSSEESTSEEEGDGDESSDFDGDDKDQKKKAGWDNVAADADGDDDDDEEEEETAAPSSQATKAGSDPRAALLAAISGKKPAPAGASESKSGDPRAGLLAAIKGRKDDDDRAAASSDGGGGDPRSGLLAAIKGRQRDDESSKPAAPEDTGGDPRSGLLAAIKAKRAEPASPAEKKEAKADEDESKDTGWRVGTNTDDDPEADGRNSLLNAIRAKRKE